MAKYVCPSCGKSYNGKKCRACLYENFAEEIAHGGHSHRGEPLVIDAPVRRPIPKKDPFGCEKQTRKSVFPRREKKQRPFAGLLTIFLLIYSFLPLVRNWGLELEAREAAVQMEMAMPEDLVTLYEEGPITISTQSHCLNEFPDSGLRLWVKNEQRQMDVYLTTKYVMADGFVLPNTGLYMECSADSVCLDTLYLEGEDLKDAGITQVRELIFVLECTDESYTVLFETDPITITRESVPVPSTRDPGGIPLIDEGGIRMDYLYYQPDPDYPKYENGSMLFYVENNTDTCLTMDSLGAAVGGEAVGLWLWCELPAKSRAVVSMELFPLEELEFTAPSELGDLTMTVEFWDAENYSGSVTEFTVTMPMVRETPLVFR